MNLRTATRLHLRWMSILMGVIILFWLPIEDTNLTTVTLFAIGICFLGVALAEDKKKLDTSTSYFWTGFCGGFFIGPISFVLMTVKIGLHSHGMPDFTINQLLRLLELSPIWAISGILLRMSLYFYRTARRQ